MGGVVALIGLSWLGWVIASQSTPEVTSSLRSWSVESDHATTAVLDVHLGSTSVRATCVVRAYAEDHSTVGESAVKVPTDGGTDVTLSVKVRTERAATSVESPGCTAPGQKRPR